MVGSFDLPIPRRMVAFGDTLQILMIMHGKSLGIRLGELTIMVTSLSRYDYG